MAVVGFDIGTLYCVISQAKRGGIDTVLNENSKRQTSSFVSFQGNQRYIGEQAVPLARSNYKNTVVNFKRLLGRAWSDPTAQREISLMPNKDSFVQLDNDAIGVKVAFNDEEKTFSMEQITAMMLNQLRKTVSSDLSSDVVVSVPGYWNDRQRRAMLDSCRVAGFNALALLNDHTASALSYGIYKSARNVFDPEVKQHVMFVDIGYANMSVAIVSFVQGKLQVVAQAFDENLGGRDFDFIILDKFVEDFKASSSGLDAGKDQKARIKLLAACEKAKQTLTPEGVNLAKVQVEFLMNEIDFKGEVTLDTFESLSQPLLERIGAVVEECVKKSGLSKEDINSVEIVGGGTRPKIVKKKIAEAMGLDLEKHNYGLSTTLNLDESVSRGCALNSAMLSPQFRVKEFNVFDAVNLPVKLKWDQHTNSEEEGSTGVVILGENASTPATKRVTFKRDKPFEITAFYDDDKECQKRLPEGFNSVLSTFKVNATAGKSESEEKPTIRVDFKHDRNGLFDVLTAEMLTEVVPPPEEDKPKEGEEEKEKPKEGEEEVKKEKKKQYTKQKLQVEVKHTYGLSGGQLKEMCEAEKKYSEADRIFAETAAARNSLESYIYAYRDKLDLGLREYVTEEEKKEFSDMLEKEEGWLYDEGFDESKDEYLKRYNGLKQKGDRYDTRVTQEEERPKAAKELSSKVNEFLSVVNSVEEKFDHITEDEREKVRSVAKEATEWLSKQQQAQDKLKKSEDPVLTSELVREQLAKLVAASHMIVNKRRPPPPKKEEPSPSAESTEKKEGEEPKDEEKATKEPPKEDESMDVD